MDINLQSDSELPEQNFNDSEDESIVVSYLKNKDKVNRRDGVLFSSKKKSSLLNDVLKLETIPESDQVSTVIDPSIKISENSLDVYIPSFPGSPRSLDYGSEPSIDSEFEEYQHDARLKEAIEFLHADKDLLIAAETGNDQHIEMILRRTDIHVQQMDHLGRNALHLAVCSDNLRAIELLLKGGVSPNVKDSVGMTPLSLCLMRRPSLTVAKLLFDYGAKLMPRTDPMDTGLFIQFVMMSTPTDEEENIMELLIQKGALVNDPDAPGGRQPLHFAAMSNNCTLIRILVNLGASLYLTNHRNETPKEVAATFDCKDAYDLLNDLELEDMVPMQSRGRQTSPF
ncbi:protein VAPYRIN-like [Pieris rapae]|uniref:protein VAPYRIN-like n=1 Tax=Pieris rapae TaxID=64459 RepID=UPI001E27DED8|nr:protein VAPYRIN-like [Pieris rapae]